MINVTNLKTMKLYQIMPLLMLLVMHLWKLKDLLLVIHVSQLLKIVKIYLHHVSLLKEQTYYRKLSENNKQNKQKNHWENSFRYANNRIRGSRKSKAASLKPRKNNSARSKKTGNQNIQNVLTLTQKPGHNHTSPKQGPSHIYIDDSFDLSNTDEEIQYFIAYIERTF